MARPRLTHRLDELGRRAVVRAQLAVDDAAASVEHAARDGRWRALRADGERGAQAAEYAMLGGVAAAGCGVMVLVLNEQQDTLGGLVGEWLGRIFEFAGQFLSR